MRKQCVVNKRKIVNLQEGEKVLKIAKCQECGTRVFDHEEGAAGDISIKCPRCKKVVRISLAKAS